MIRILFIIFTFAYLQIPSVSANPGTAAIQNGNVTINVINDSSNMDINQTTETGKFVIKWESFNIVDDEPIKFMQPTSSSTALNRVVGANASYIYGQLSDNGRIFVINPHSTVINDSITGYLQPSFSTYPSINDSTYLVAEGSAIRIDSSLLYGNDSTPLGPWTQLYASTVELSDPWSDSPIFFTPTIKAGESKRFVFEQPRQNSVGSTLQIRADITVIDNGIDVFPEDVLSYPVKHKTGKAFGLTLGNESRLIYLENYDPATINDSRNMPSDMPIGLLDFTIQVETPGDTAKITVHLEDPAPNSYGWFKYSESDGWSNFSEYAEFNTDRTQITLSLTDGGPGDEDGEVNGVIIDPSGLGISSSSDSDGISLVGDSSCFITTIGNNKKSKSAFFMWCAGLLFGVLVITINYRELKEKHRTRRSTLTA